LVGAHVERDARVVTFTNGMVVRERIVTGVMKQTLER
jgi:hypothetical protein